MRTSTPANHVDRLALNSHGNEKGDGSAYSGIPRKSVYRLVHLNLSNKLLVFIFCCSLINYNIPSFQDIVLLHSMKQREK